MKTLLLLLLIAPNLQNGAAIGYAGPSDYKRGAEHREIAESSPYVREVIQQVTPEAGMHAKISIRATIHNLTDHEVVYVDPGQFYDVYDNKTGSRASNTAAGCFMNFFLDCYAHLGPVGTARDGPPKDKIPAHDSIVDVRSGYLETAWQLPPGEYTVVGYYCSAKREGAQCVKSNKLPLTIP